MNTLDELRKEAKHWLKSVRTGNPGHVKRLRLAFRTRLPYRRCATFNMR